MSNAGRGKIPSALRFLHGSDLVLQVSILPSEVLDVVGVTSILASHEGDVFTGLLQNLCSAALVSLKITVAVRNLVIESHYVELYLEGWNGVLQPTEAVLDVVSSLPLQLVVMGSLPVVGQLRRKAENIIFVLKQNLLIIAKKNKS